jgi:hypothetical protein
MSNRSLARKRNKTWYARRDVGVLPSAARTRLDHQHAPILVLQSPQPPPGTIAMLLCFAPGWACVCVASPANFLPAEVGARLHCGSCSVLLQLIDLFAAYSNFLIWDLGC